MRIFFITPAYTMELFTSFELFTRCAKSNCYNSCDNYIFALVLVCTKKVSLAGDTQREMKVRILPLALHLVNQRSSTDRMLFRRPPVSTGGFYLVGRSASTNV